MKFPQFHLLLIVALNIANLPSSHAFTIPNSRRLQHVSSIVKRESNLPRPTHLSVTYPNHQKEPTPSLEAVKMGNVGRKWQRNYGAIEQKLESVQQKVLVAEARATAAEQRLSILKEKADEYMENMKWYKYKYETKELELTALEESLEMEKAHLRNDSQRRESELKAQIEILKISLEKSKQEFEQYQDTNEDRATLLRKVNSSLEAATEALTKERTQVEELRHALELLKLEMEAERANKWMKVKVSNGNFVSIGDFFDP